MVFWDFDGVIKESFSVRQRLLLNYLLHTVTMFVTVRSHHIENAGISRFDKIPLYLKWSGLEPTNIRVDDACSQFNRIVKNKVINLINFRC